MDPVVDGEENGVLLENPVGLTLGSTDPEHCWFRETVMGDGSLLLTYSDAQTEFFEVLPEND